MMKEIEIKANSFTNMYHFFFFFLVYAFRTTTIIPYENRILFKTQDVLSPIAAFLLSCSDTLLTMAWTQVAQFSSWSSCVTSFLDYSHIWLFSHTRSAIDYNMSSSSSVHHKTSQYAQTLHSYYVHHREQLFVDVSQISFHPCPSVEVI